MSVPRVMLAPTHHSGLANAVAASVAEIATAQGHRVRYHHLGALTPPAAWDRWEGASFLDPGLYSEQSVLALYDVATRGATLSLLSCTRGVLDAGYGVDWVPAEIARTLDCPVVVVMDCRGWGTGIGALVSGLRSALSGVNFAGAVLTGVADGEHLAVLRRILSTEGVPTVGGMFEGDGPGWSGPAPGPWNLPLEPAVLDAVGRQVDIGELEAIAGQRGFLAAQSGIADRGSDGPLVMVAGGKGFTPWSRDSIEVLRSAGANVRRLDLLEDETFPEETCGLVLAGTIWPAAFTDVALNLPLCRELRARISGGLPTVAMGGGMLALLSRVRDTLGRSVELVDVLPAEGEILWDLEEPIYVRITAERDNLLLSKGETVNGWVCTEADILHPAGEWDPLFTVRGVKSGATRGEGVGTSSLLCTGAFLHFAATPGPAGRFVSACAAYGARRAP